MQVILKPVSHPELGEIVIRDNLFPIGRHEKPFTDYGPEVTAKLSRRHARIFEQDGAVYLVDLGSLNGTVVNGTPLDKRPVQIRQGDEIGFGGYLNYRAELLGRGETGAAVTEQLSGVVLTLLPERPESGVEPLVVSQFPFMISKSDESFARYRQQFPEEVRFLSRRHAHIFVRDRELYIEDLGSTNGTFLSGVRLDEQARILKDGDRLAFGGEHFTYRVHISVLDQARGVAADDSVLTEALNSSADITRTTFVTSANSFIDIFCADDEDGEAAVDDADEQVAAVAGASGGKPPRRTTVFVRELRRAFFGEKKPGTRRSVWGAAAALVLLAAVVAFTYYQSAPRRAVEQLLNEGDYAQSAARADAFLAQHADDEEIAELASTATIRALMPDWTARIEAGEFDAARALTTGARRASEHNPSVQPLLAVLDWVADLEQFMHERGGTDAPVVMFRDEPRIDELLDWWDSDASEHRRATGRVTRYDSGFESILARALSHLRTLRSEKSLYLAAIDDFKRELQQRLDSDDLAGLAGVLDEFSARYPRIAGVQALAQDMAHYRALDEALTSHDWIAAIEAVGDNRFLTPPFREKVAQIRETRLPPKPVAMQYRQARELWRQGRGDEAVGLLETLTGGEWGRIASAELAHKREVLKGYAALTGADRDQGYAGRLLAFHGTLDPVEDLYFVEALSGEFKTYRDALLKEADAAFAKAGRAWEEYDRSGRILGLLRLEANVSNTFRERAKRLAQAYENAHNGAKLYASLGGGLDPERQALHDKIMKECRLQRRSLQELGMVLDTALLRAKLDLLPDPAPAGGQDDTNEDR